MKTAKEKRFTFASKALFGITLSVFLMLPAALVFANEEDGYVYTHEVIQPNSAFNKAKNDVVPLMTPEEVEALHREQIDALVKYLEDPRNRNRIETRTIILNQNVLSPWVWQRAGGQLANGQRFPTGGHFSWAPTNASASVSLSLGWGPVSVGFDAGRANAGGTTGVGINIPNHLVGDIPLHLYVGQQYSVTRTRTEQRPFESNGPWTLLIEQTFANPVERSFEIRRAR